MERINDFSEYVGISLEEIQEALGITQKKIEETDDIDVLIDIYENSRSGSITQEKAFYKIITLCDSFKKCLELHSLFCFESEYNYDFHSQTIQKLIQLVNNFNEAETAYYHLEDYEFEDLLKKKTDELVKKFLLENDSYDVIYAAFERTYLCIYNQDLFIEKLVSLATDVKNLKCLYSQTNNQEIIDKIVQKIDNLNLFELEEHRDFEFLKMLYKFTPQECHSKGLLFDEILFFCVSLEDYHSVYEISDPNSYELDILESKIEDLLRSELDKAQNITEIKEIYDYSFIDSNIEKIILEKMYEVYLNS